MARGIGGLFSQSCSHARRGSFLQCGDRFCNAILSFGLRVAVNMFNQNLNSKHKIQTSDRNLLPSKPEITAYNQSLQATPTQPTIKTFHQNLQPKPNIKAYNQNLQTNTLKA